MNYLRSSSEKPSSPIVNTIQQGNLVIDFFINEDIVEIHTRFILSLKKLHWNGVISPEEEDLSPQLVNLIRSIELIPGVDRPESIEKYSIGIIKAKAFSWQEIIPLIEKRLNDYSEWQP